MERNKVIEAAKYIVRFCKISKCYQCPFHYTSPHDGVPICLFTGDWPEDWKVGELD